MIVKNMFNSDVSSLMGSPSCFIETGAWIEVSDKPWSSYNLPVGTFETAYTF